MASRRIRGLVLMVGACAVGAAAWLAVGARASPPRAPRSETEPATDELERKVASLEHRLQAMQTQVQTVKAAAQPGLDGGAHKAAAEPPPPGGPRLTAKERDQMITNVALNRMEAEMKQQPADVDWERESRAAFDALFAKPEVAGSTLAEVTCTRTLCRSVLNHESAAVREKFMDEGGLSQPPFKSDRFFHYSEETGKTVVYFARRGQQLPKLDLSSIPPWP